MKHKSKNKINLDRFYLFYDVETKYVNIFDTKDMVCLINIRKNPNDDNLIADRSSIIEPSHGAKLIQLSMSEENRKFTSEKLRSILNPDEVINVPIEVDQDSINRLIQEKLGLNELAQMEESE